MKEKQKLTGKQKATVLVQVIMAMIMLIGGIILMLIMPIAGIIMIVLSLILLLQNNTPKTVKVELANDKKDDKDDLYKLKQLLDDGIITQEEFDTKKKDILGL